MLFYGRMTLEIHREDVPWYGMYTCGAIKQKLNGVALYEKSRI